MNCAPMRFSDIPRFTRPSGYHVNVSWAYLEEHLKLQMTPRRAGDTLARLDLCPDFQRGHVWTEDQQIAYVEYVLRGGTSGRDLHFNCAGWMSDWRGPYVIVDGLQRLTAVRRFLAGEIPAVRRRIHEFEEALSPFEPGFLWHVHNLPTRAEVLAWYLEMNSGGTPHTVAELERVRALLETEKGRSPEP